MEKDRDILIVGVGTKTDAALSAAIYYMEKLNSTGVVVVDKKPDPFLPPAIPITRLEIPELKYTKFVSEKPNYITGKKLPRKKMRK